MCEQAAHDANDVPQSCTVSRAGSLDPLFQPASCCNASIKAVEEEGRTADGFVLDKSSSFDPEAPLRRNRAGFK